MLQVPSNDGRQPPLREAKLRYEHGRYTILAPGDYVVCAVTGEKIPLEALRYWSVAHQEAYVDVVASTRAEEARGKVP